MSNVHVQRGHTESDGDSQMILLALLCGSVQSDACVHHVDWCYWGGVRAVKEVGREGERGREVGREGGREVGREGKRGREGGRKGERGREGGREGGKEKEGGREGGRKGGRKGGRGSNN